MKTSETGINSVSFRNALSYAKRNALKEVYSFNELIEDAKFSYILSDEETDMLKEKMINFCRDNHLYTRDI